MLTNKALNLLSFWMSGLVRCIKSIHLLRRVAFTPSGGSEGTVPGSIEKASCVQECNMFASWSYGRGSIGTELYVVLHLGGARVFFWFVSDPSL